MKTSLKIFFCSFLLVAACQDQDLQKGQTNSENVETKKIIPPKIELLPSLESYLSDVEENFRTINSERINELKYLASTISKHKKSNDKLDLIFICTRNSRRSHMSQIWAQTAAYYYGLQNVNCYSGGTGSTAFNPRSVRAMKKAGFEVVKKDSSTNPIYEVKFSEHQKPVKAFSKKYTHSFNPQKDFIAVMTCSKADEACPVVYGALDRISIPYEDPKIADNTPQEEAKYDERSKQICTEMFYIFSQVSGKSYSLR